MLYGALAPMLPAFEHELALSKSQAGVLVGAYPLGTLLGTLPSGLLVARRGPRAVLLWGLLVMSLGGAGFALAQTLALLDVARFAHGVGAAMSWTAGLAWLVRVAPSERRGETIGLAIGAAIFGAQFGPVVGVGAESIGRAPVFLVVAGLGLLLAVGARGFGDPPAAPTATRSPLALTRDRSFLVAVWLTMLPSLVFGSIEVLVPLRLDELGAGVVAIGAAFVAAAIAEALVSPLVGRIADRRGTRPVVRIGTLAGAVAVALLTLPGRPLALAAVLVLVAAALGMLWAPGGRLASLRADDLGVDQGWAFALNNAGFSAGIGIGAVAGGGLGQVAGDGLPYALGALGLALTGTLMLRRSGVRALADDARQPARSA